MNHSLWQCMAWCPSWSPRRLALMLGIVLIGICSSESAQCQIFGIQAQQDAVNMYLFNGQDEATFRPQLEMRSKFRLSRIVEVSHLDQAAAAKLALAVDADLNRFYRCVGQAREKTKGLDLQNQAEMQQAWQEIMPLQQRLSEGLLEEGSLFQKVLEATLSPEQRLAYEEYLAERQRAKNLALLKISIADVERSIPMLAKQRDALLAAAAGIDAPPKLPQGAEPQLGFMLLAKVADEDVKAIFDEAQQKSFKKLQKRYGANQRGIIR